MGTWGSGEGGWLISGIKNNNNNNNNKTMAKIRQETNLRSNVLSV